MRLKKLTVQAFGPFKNKEVIDFQNISGLLLITGDTGAGKTTIFDAICFALYGEVSGEDRKSSSVRSDYATSNTETFVELEFYYNNKLYTVKRTPGYIREKKSGSGTTTVPPSAEFEINGRIINKFKDVTNEIVNLIGLDVKQFRQVCMLSQGEFSKFLLASSDEKTSIFRKIFNTSIYSNIMDKLKEDLINVSRSYEDIKKYIDKEKNEDIDNDTYINTLNEKIESSSKELERIKKEKDNINILYTKKHTEYEMQESINKKINLLNDTNLKLKELFDNNKNIDNNKKLLVYNDTVVRNIEIISNSIEINKKSIEDNKNKLKSSNDTLELLKNQYKEKEDLFNKLDKFEENYDSLQNKKNLLSDKLKDLNRYKEIKKEKDELKNCLSIYMENYKNENDLYLEMEKKYYLNEAYILSEKLNDGCACPVCGSLEHPNKAKKTLDVVSKEELDRQNNILKSAFDKKNECIIKIDEKEKLLLELNVSNVDDELNYTTLEYKQVELDIDNLVKETNKLKEEKSKLTSLLLKKEQEVENYSKAISDLDKILLELDLKLSDLYIKFNTNEDEYNKNKLNSDDLNKLRKNISYYDEKSIEYNNTIKNLMSDIGDRKKIDIDDKLEELNTLKEEITNYEKNYTEIMFNLNNLKNSRDNIISLLDEYKKLESKYKMIKYLSDTANGKLVGKQKMNFENFVQSYYLSSVINEANKRLLKMTDGRFNLLKKENPTSLTEKMGLEFLIFDANTGKVRDVYSLSGGEKFKASLSLALGLSDVISMYAGGIKMDCLFVDEGFGSLDQESLNQALNVLTDLVDNDKLVGIISHVQELISRIDKKIVVKKTNVGSKVEVQI